MTKEIVSRITRASKLWQEPRDRLSPCVPARPNRNEYGLRFDSLRWLTC